MSGVKEEQGVNKCFHTSCSLGGRGKKIVWTSLKGGLQMWRDKMLGTSSVKSKEKGKGKVKGDAGNGPGCRRMRNR
jgi:hypothetical protein